MTDQPTAPGSSGELPVDFRAFHEIHRPAYVRWAETYLGCRADAEEAVDDAIEQLATTWEEVLTKESPAAWAWKVMKNRVIDYARARGRRAALAHKAFDTAALRTAADPIGQLEETLSLYHAILRLPPRQQDVVMLVELWGFTTEEVATHLGITPATVRSTARHARRTLRTLLEQHEGTNSDDLH